jgi:hypothetical protein
LFGHAQDFELQRVGLFLRIRDFGAQRRDSIAQLRKREIAFFGGTASIFQDRRFRSDIRADLIDFPLA